MKKKLVFLLVLCFSINSSCSIKKRILVFTKTEGFRHESIETGVKTFRDLGDENDFIVDQTEDASIMNGKDLQGYDLIVFLSTTGDILNDEQQESFENYMRNGGSFMGIHAAADTEYDWSWYGKLVGAYFLSHPKITEAQIIVENNKHVSTSHLDEKWIRQDEWYNYKSINPNIKVLLRLDETTYEGGANGGEHPIAWYHEFDGGKSFYTGGGHTKESYNDPEFRKHLLGGILYCLGD